MTMPFQNSIVGQQGTLVRSQIKSPNFSLAGQTGWAILKNGSAYFFNITATGTITATAFVGTDFYLNSAGAFFYSASPAVGNLTASIATAPGNDGLPGGGNRYGAPGFWAYANDGTNFYAAQYAAARLSAGGIAAVQLNWANSAAGLTATRGGIYVISNAGAAAQVLVTTSGVLAFNTTALVEIQGELDAQSMNIPANSGKHFGVDGNGVIYLIKTLVTDLAGLAQLTGDTNNRWQIRGDGQQSWGTGAAAPDTNLYRGGVGTLQTDSTIAAAPFSSTIATASNTVAETVIGTINIPAGDANSFTTAYQWKIAGNINAAAAMNVTLRMRIGGLAGNVLATFGPFTVRGLIVGMAFAIDGNAMCRGNGAGGHFDSWTYCAEQIVATASAVHADQTQFIAQDTTVAYTIVLTAQMSVANAGNQAQTQEVNCVRFSH